MYNIWACWDLVIIKGIVAQCLPKVQYFNTVLYGKLSQAAFRTAGLLHWLGALSQKAFADLYSIEYAKLINPKPKRRRIADYEAGNSCEFVWVSINWLLLYKKD